jgi:hypothetical protein
LLAIFASGYVGDAEDPKLYGFKYDVKATAPSSIILQISHITEGDVLLAPNSVYTITDVEIRSCVPEVDLSNDLFEEVCFEDMHVITASYTYSSPARAIIH